MPKKQVLKRTQGRPAKSDAGVTIALPDDNDTFEILVDPPPPIRGATKESIEFIDRLVRTLDQVKVGQAFIIPTNKKPAVHKYVKTYYAGDRFVFIKIPDNPKSTRVHRLELSSIVKKKK